MMLQIIFKFNLHADIADGVGRAFRYVRLSVCLSAL